MMDQPWVSPSGMTVADVLSAFRMAWPGSDGRIIEDAYAVAAQWHAGQRRRSGDPYITHPVAVAMIVAELGMRQELICAALLHDLPCDTGYSLSRLREEFGAAIADLVAGVIMLDRGMYEGGQYRAPGAAGWPPVSRDVLVLKLADRLHNMRTIQFLPPAKQRRRSQHTVQVLAPLAAQLGMDTIEQELTDLATRILHPECDGQPGTVTHWTLKVAAVLLPGPVRARWLEEWAGELATLPSRRSRTAFIAQIILGIPRLSLTLHYPISNRIREKR